MPRFATKKTAKRISWYHIFNRSVVILKVSVIDSVALTLTKISYTCYYYYYNDFRLWHVTSFVSLFRLIEPGKNPTFFTVSVGEKILENLFQNHLVLHLFLLQLHLTIKPWPSNIILTRIKFLVWIRRRVNQAVNWINKERRRHWHFLRILGVWIKNQRNAECQSWTKTWYNIYKV